MKTSPIIFAVCMALSTEAAFAEEAESWVVKVGAHVVDPKSDNGNLAGGTLHATIGSDVKPTVTAEYMIDPSWGIEILASLPFQHDVSLNGTTAASVKHLPPTVGLQYHFSVTDNISPFVGLGINYTFFMSEHGRGNLAGDRINLDNSLGPAVHVGVDFNLNKRWCLSVDARWIRISSDVSVNGTKVGTVHIDPLAYGFAVGYKF